MLTLSIWLNYFVYVHVSLISDWLNQTFFIQSVIVIFQFLLNHSVYMWVYVQPEFGYLKQDKKDPPVLSP